MKIIVLVKQVPDSTEIRVDKVTGTLIRAGVPSIINPDDLAGVEAALQLKEKMDATVTIVSMGPPQAAEMLKELDLGLDTRLTSKVGLLSGGQRQAVTLLMATLKKPKVLLLDEHTAALDPKTAKKVLDLTEKIVARDHLTTIMITHNMKDAIAIGNRLIMMNEGKIIYDVSGEEKKKLTTKDLLDKFKVTSGEEFDNDRVLLSTEAGE